MVGQFWGGLSFATTVYGGGISSATCAALALSSCGAIEDSSNWTESSAGRSHAVRRRCLDGPGQLELRLLQPMQQHVRKPPTKAKTTPNIMPKNLGQSSSASRRAIDETGIIVVVL